MINGQRIYFINAGSYINRYGDLRLGGYDAFGNDWFWVMLNRENPPMSNIKLNSSQS